MLPIHLYYLNDAYIVSVWNCDICDILWSLGKDNGSPLLARFVADVRLLPEVRRFVNGKDGTGIRAGS